MADDKNGRENQAQNAERRQREREVAEQRRRHDEPEPPFESEQLERVETTLETISFPATTREIVTEVGDHTLETPDRTYRLADLLPEADIETFDEPGAVAQRIARPTVASAMKRIIESADQLQDASLRRSQREAYERTFRELIEIDPVDEDEGITVVTEWILQRIEERGRVPGSRDVRRRAASFCRDQGHEVRVDEWLGV